MKKVVKWWLFKIVFAFSLLQCTLQDADKGHRWADRAQNTSWIAISTYCGPYLLDRD